MNDPIQAAPDAVRAAYQRLTPKRAAFALAIPTAPSLVQAAVSAGYTDKAAKAKSSGLAQHPDVKVVVDWLTSTTLAAAQLTVEGVMRELAALVFADPAALFDPNTGALKPPRAWPEAAGKFVTAVDVADLYEGSGDDRTKVGEVHKLKFADKLGAVNTALKLLNAFPEKKKAVTHTHRVGVVVVPAKQPWGDAGTAAQGSAAPLVSPPLTTSTQFRLTKSLIRDDNGSIPE
ncbi:terminase small subunit [Lysobacter firmicutimachus]|uniref:Terminase small subunit n=1 Tax=Lysobacter firmicutimachus TaxID=1792846 RepID=A0ABU8D028_9GAMM